MPGRKKLKIVERRTPSQPSTLQGPAASRPKRNVMSKKSTDTEGISWREEKMLQKALYASLHPNASTISTQGTSLVYGSGFAQIGYGGKQRKWQRGRPPLGQHKHKSGHKLSTTQMLAKKSLQRLKTNLKLLMPGGGANGREEGGGGTGGSTPASTASSNSNGKNASKSCSAYKAQRKFAAGSLVSSPSVTPVKYHSMAHLPHSRVKFMLKKPPKTEDFLNFLCLRGTSLLPKELEFFNYCDSDLLRAMNSPTKGSTHTSGARGRPCLSGTRPSANGGGGSSSGAPTPLSVQTQDEDGKPLVTRAFASCSVSPAHTQRTVDDDAPSKCVRTSPARKHLTSRAALTSVTSQAEETGDSSSALYSDSPTSKSTPKKFVSTSPIRNNHFRTPLPGIGDSVTSSYQASSEDSSQDSTCFPRSLDKKPDVKRNAFKQEVMIDNSGSTTPSKWHVNEEDNLEVPKDALRTPTKSIKKDHGQRLIKKAKAVFVAQQIQMALQSRQSKSRSSDRGMLTRQRRDLIETEKFTEARLESLYSKNTRSSGSKSGSSSRNGGGRVKGGGVVAKDKPGTPSSTSTSTMSSSDRQTRNTPSKMEALCAAQHKSSSSGKRCHGSPVVIIDDTPIKKPRHSTRESSPIVISPCPSKDPPTPTRRNTRQSGTGTEASSVTSRTCSTDSDSGTITPLSALPRDLDLTSPRSLRSSASPSRLSGVSGSPTRMSTVSGSPSRLSGVAASPLRVTTAVPASVSVTRGRSPCSVQSEASTDSTRKRKNTKRLSLRSMNTEPEKYKRTKVQAPTYHPCPEQFQDRMQYIESIRADAEPFGMCCIVPPEVWKPECCVSQELRFITEIQHLHKMKDRWGTNAEQMECIRKHLSAQGIRFDQPVVGGIELDLPALSRAIRHCGGISTVADDKRKWQKVADILRIPKWAQDRSFKLYDCYCKYLLSYDTLNEQERSRLSAQVQADRKRGRINMDCVIKGKSRSLAEFFMLARSTLVRWFKNVPTATEVEEEYWRILSEQNEHVAVHSAHVDTKNCGGGFPTIKDSPYSKHGWNFNVLQHNNESVLRHLGLVSGITIPELHMGMLFSTNCWSSDPHGLPFISYLHTGNDIIWYCIPRSEEALFKEVLQRRAPDLIDYDSPIWLPVDSVMMSPDELRAEGLSVYRLTQRQGEFMVVFPQSFTATVCCGYNISESIRVATPEWLHTGYHMSKALHESCEPELFSMDRLLLRLARSDKVDVEVLRHLLPTLETTINEEIAARQKLLGAGLKNVEKIPKPGSEGSGNRKCSDGGRKKLCAGAAATRGGGTGVAGAMEEDRRCEMSKKICYLSMVLNEADNTVYSLHHALRHIHRKKNIANFKLQYRYSEKELLSLLERVKDRLTSGQNTRHTQHHS